MLTQFVSNLDQPRILVTRTDRIGDLILSTPVFTALRERFPKAHLACLTFCENREIIEGNPAINEVILYDKKGAQKSWWGNFLFAGQLRKKKFDIVIHLHGTNRMHWLTLLAGIRVRIGWDRRMPWALTHSHAYAKKEGQKHEAEYNFDLLKDLGVDCPEKLKTIFPVTPKSQASVKELLAQKYIEQELPLVVISPSASDPSKTWAPERFAETVEAINKQGVAAFVAIGAYCDRSYVQQVQSKCSVSIHDLSGQLSLGMLGALLEQADLLVSNDSGPVHVAQAVGTPVVSVFVRRDPGLSSKRWGPLGENAVILHSDECDAQSVVEAATKLGVEFKRKKDLVW